MLILVGVTVTVAVNGGLFEKSKETAKGTEIEREKEELTSAITTAYNVETGKVDKTKLKDALGTGWNIEGDTAPYTVTSPKGNKFTVDINGTITEGEKENTPPAPVLPEGLRVGSEFEMDADQDGTEETWIVLYDGTASHLNENEIEVISKKTMGKDLALGKTDTEAIENATDINGTVDEIEIAIYSYNNAIDRINNYCNDLIKIGNLEVRSVGSKPSDPSYRNTSKPYAIKYLDKWPNKTAWNTYGVLGEDEDTNSVDDWTQMDSLGIKKSGDVRDYWLASRYVDEFRMGFNLDWYVDFGVTCMESNGRTGDFSLWRLCSDGRAYTGEPAFRVRPVVKLQYP